MSFDFLTEYQIHILVRIVTVAGLFLGLLAFTGFLSRRHEAQKKVRAEKVTARAGVEFSAD